VMVLRDAPRPPQSVGNVPDCVAAHRNDLHACSGKRSSWMRSDPLAIAARQLADNRIEVADLTNYFCTATTCSSVIGGVIVYFDHQHVTKTYSESLAPFLVGPMSRIVAKAVRD
ncbi:MAG: SGNH hydrolase domain-containing protein, partial [Aeromicrobium sp.]